MSGLDIEAIRERSRQRLRFHADQTPAVLPNAAEDIATLVAEIERLRAEVFTLTNSEDARVFFVEQERDQDRAALADALQVIADLRGGTP